MNRSETANVTQAVSVNARAAGCRPPPRWSIAAATRLSATAIHCRRSSGSPGSMEAMAASIAILRPKSGATRDVSARESAANTRDWPQRYDVADPNIGTSHAGAGDSDSGQSSQAPGMQTAPIRAWESTRSRRLLPPPLPWWREMK